MRVIQLKNISKTRLQTITLRSAGTYRSIMPEVKTIMDAVQRQGDIQLYKKYQSRFGEDNYTSIKVSREEIKRAYTEVNEAFITALKQMIKNITAVHRAQLPTKKDKVVSPEAGIIVWREWRPIEKVGLYIPGGKAIYPSSVLMSAIPAQIAGCKNIVMCSPPRKNGQLPAATLVAADMIGLTNICKIGGAEAIAAMTYGTETVPAVYKIFGAGNSYVTAAKMLASEKVAIDACRPFRGVYYR